jgi:release factor glutamine methyltransferase
MKRNMPHPKGTSEPQKFRAHAIPQEDTDTLIRDKYAGDSSRITEEDLERLRTGEPLAYVIGNIPFLGLTIWLDTKPLIPRPETEWWTEQLISHINNTTIYGGIQRIPCVLDLCAGSGAIGLAILKHCPKVKVSFGELVPKHAKLILKNIRENGLDESRADICTGDVFAPFTSTKFDFIATNPPYIAHARELPKSVSDYEPTEALYGGQGGLEIIRRILEGALTHLNERGELWMECDIENIDEAQTIAKKHGAVRSEIRNDQYSRPRLLVTYY